MLAKPLDQPAQPAALRFAVCLFHNAASLTYSGGLTKTPNPAGRGKAKINS
jgi:hypothetical protein